ncbi:GxxExxY protein [Clostridium gasigenes]|uniref:AAA family ATPase n=1 Tax=Clostridium gasigenes TaxID=94869 RepID=A0A7X0VSQ1_9CLOT|nr:GxxExxY protein [Clostridium gasigenes]MBB6716148.1 AAA family ATPase [Clostridium gasigenes]
MEKYFNTTGVCVPKKHYMVNVDNKLNEIIKLINKENYFTINRPRQFGKTTILNELSKMLSDKYIVITISFEGIGDIVFQNESYFSQMFIDLLSDSLDFNYPDESKRLLSLATDVKTLKDLSKVITKFVKDSSKEVILFIDEVDKSSNNQLFLSFIGMLRNKYLAREIDKDFTFKSVILAGVHDVKTLKLKLRGDEEKKLNSPWNIAVNFKVDMSFNTSEIETMLIEYCLANNLEMDTKLFADRLYYYTSGYPFLVSRLCQIIDEDILEIKSNWTLDLLEKALKQLFKESNTLFEDLFKNIENNQDLSDYIFDIIFNGEMKIFNINNPLIALGYLYGIFKEENNIIKMSNRVYEQIIYDYFSSKLENTTSNIINYNFRNNFLLSNGGLDMNKVLLKFQQFMKEQYSTKDVKFLEHNGRTLFLAFLKPIINGVGFDFKEVQISEEKRLDIVVTYNNFKYIIELKIWRGESYHKKGIQQLYDYLDIHSVDEGYLLIFNFNADKEYKDEVIKINNKDLFTVYL